MFCPRCGAHNDDNAWKCEQCGADMRSYVPQVGGYAGPVTSSKAIWSLVLALVGPCCCTFVFGIVAIILGLQARNEIRDFPERYKGDGLALAGIIIGIFDVVMGIVVPILLAIFRGYERGLF